MWETGGVCLPGWFLRGCQGSEIKLWFFTRFGSQSKAAALAHWLLVLSRAEVIKGSPCWPLKSAFSFLVGRGGNRNHWRAETRAQRGSGRTKVKGINLKIKGEAKGLFKNIGIRGEKMQPTLTYRPGWLYYLINRSNGFTENFIYPHLI